MFSAMLVRLASQLQRGDYLGVAPTCVRSHTVNA